MGLRAGVAGRRAAANHLVRLRACVSVDAATDFAVFEDLGLPRILPAMLRALGDSEALTSNVDRRLETSATRFDCCLSQPISDGVKGWLTTKDTAFEFGEVLKPVTELSLPEGLKLAAMTPY